MSDCECGEKGYNTIIKEIRGLREISSHFLANVVFNVVIFY